MISPARAALAGALLGVAAACTIPTEGCACPPARSHGVAHGTVLTAAGAPVAGARVHALMLTPSCAADFTHADPIGNQRPQSGADGSYELHFYSFSGADAQCVRIVAERAPGDSALTEVPAFPLEWEREAPPRHRVDILFP